MKRNNLKTFFIAFLILFGTIFVSAWSTAPSSTPPDNNTQPPMDASSNSNKKDAGLSVNAFSSGTTQSSLIKINSIGNVGIKTDPLSTVRLYVNGDVKSSSLTGTGNSAICVGTGNQLIRCQ